MDPVTVISIVNAVANLIVTAAPLFIEAEKNARPFAEAVVNVLKGHDLTQADIDNLLAQANALSNRIQSPDFIPVEQSDDV